MSMIGAFHEPDFAAVHTTEAEGGEVLYLRGLSTGEFQPALKGLLGEDAGGLSSANISRLIGVWEGEWESWCGRSLDEVDYVYVWVDGIHLNVRQVLEMADPHHHEGLGRAPPAACPNESGFSGFGRSSHSRPFRDCSTSLGQSSCRGAPSSSGCSSPQSKSLCVFRRSGPGGPRQVGRPDRARGQGSRSEATLE